SARSARNAASILRRRYATVIGTPLSRHASLTLQVSASTLRKAIAFAFDQSRAARFLSCGVFAATRVISFFRATLSPAHPDQPASGVRAKENGPRLQGGRPKSLFLTVPDVYRMSV